MSFFSFLEVCVGLWVGVLSLPLNFSRILDVI